MPKTFYICVMLCLTQLCLTLPAFAQERLAVIIGNGDYKDVSLSKPASNGIAVSHSLLALGFDVNRLENVNAENYALEGRKADTVIIYFSGKASTVDGQTILLSVEQNREGFPSGWVLNDLVSGYLDAGSKRVLVFLDVCHAEMATGKSGLMPALEGANIFQAQAGEPDTRCPVMDETTPDFTKQIIKALLAPNISLSGSLQEIDTVWSTSTLSQPYIMRRSKAQINGLTSADLEMLDRLSDEDRKKILALWRKAGIIDGNIANVEEPPATAIIPKRKKTTILLSDPVQPARVSSALMPVANIVQPDAKPYSVGSVRIFTAVASPTRRFQPTKDGLPKPSIIVGNIKPINASFDPADIGGSLSGTELNSAGFKARQKLRKEDPELFAQLLLGGAFDPIPELLPNAIQTELARMGCYTSRVDGVWGNGSRAAVDRYFKQLGATAPTRKPEISIFRQLVRKDDVVCSVSRAQASSTRVSPRAQRTTKTRTNTNRAQSTKPRATAKPTTPTGSRTIKRTMNASGVFR